MLGQKKERERERVKTDVNRKTLEGGKTRERNREISSMFYLFTVRRLVMVGQETHRRRWIEKEGRDRERASR